MTCRFVGTTLSALALMFVAPPLLADPLVPIVAGQKNDFQSGTLEGWLGCCPTPAHPDSLAVNLNGGPGGVGDAFMMISANGVLGVEGGRALAYNGPNPPGSQGPYPQWDGSYLTNNIAAIVVDLNNYNTQPIAMRIMVEGPSQGWISVNPVVIDGNTGWQRVIFSIRYEDLYNAVTPGNQTIGDYNATLGSPTRLRIVQGPNLEFPPAAFDGQIGVDNIMAIQENRSAWLNGTGGFNTAAQWRNSATPASGNQTHLVFGQDASGVTTTFGTGMGQTAAFNADNDLPGLGGLMDLNAMTLDGAAGTAPTANTIGSTLGTSFNFVNNGGFLAPTILNQSDVDYTLTTGVRLADALIVGGSGAGKLTFAGGLSGTGQTLTKRGAYILELDGGSLALDHLVVEGGEVAVANATLALSSLNNTGAIHVKPGATISAASVTQHAGTTLTGGTYRVDAGATLDFTTGSSITTNQGNVILSGVGSTFAKIITLADNQGTFEVNSGRAFTTAGAFSNTGTLRSDSGASFLVNGPVSQQSGSTLTGGTWFVGAGASLDFSIGSNITTNLANVALSGVGSTFTKFDALADNQGTFEINAGRNFATAGALSNTGTLRIGAGSTLTSTGLLSNGVGGTISGAGTIAGAVGNLGTVQAVGGTLVFSGPIVQHTTTTLTGGTWIIDVGASLDLAAGPAIDTIGAGVSVTFNGPGATFGKLAGLADNNGTFTLGQGATFTTAAALNNDGIMTLGAGVNLAAAAGLVTNSASGLLQGQGTITGSLNNAGAVIINDSAIITVTGTAANTGDIEVGQASTLTTGGLTNSGAGLVHGAGVITGAFNNNAVVRADGADTLTLTGSGAGAGQFTTQSASSTLLINGSTFDYTAGSSFTGPGVIRFASGTHHIVSNFNLGASGRLEISNATLNLNSGSTITSVGSSITLSGGGVLNVNTALAIAQQFNFTGGSIAGASTLTVSNLTWTGGSMTGPATTAVASAGIVTLAGSATKSLSSGRTFSNSGSVTVVGTGAISGTSGGGVIQNNASGVFSSQTDHLFSNLGAFNNAGLYRKSGGLGTTTFAAGWTVNNTGTVEVASGSVSLNTISQHSGSTLTGGTWKANANTNLIFNTGSNITTNNGSVVLSGANSNFARINTLNDNNGSFEINSGRNFTTTGAFNNDGVLRVGASSTFTLAAGNSLTNSATGTVSGSGAITASGGGSVVNNGTFAPGASAGTLTVNADYASAGSSHLAVEIGGHTVGTEYDRLAVNGAVSLAGILDISTINGFDPAALSTFTVLTGSSVSGSFAGTTLSGSTTKRFATSVTGNSVILTAVNLGDVNVDGLINALDINLLFTKTNPAHSAYSPTMDKALFDLNGDAAVDSSDVNFLLSNVLHRRFGDANLDGSVDAADIGILRANLGLPNTGWSSSDFNGDGTTDAADVGIIRANLGLPPPGLEDDGLDGLSLLFFESAATPSSIPEPATAAWLLLAAGAVLRRRR